MRGETKESNDMKEVVGVRGLQKSKNTMRLGGNTMERRGEKEQRYYGERRQSKPTLL